ncbi:hypothetical protein F383_25568 [Gossypium arboreum]|uniref:Uncharacterized protein n=1 Tax=Gossypium arboreum TaxID=29729 RepID=A0A0B0MIU5_GOSAR|nr:hypothetical protein F383_25568 [Gossypium arboreum]
MQYILCGSGCWSCASYRWLDSPACVADT